MLSPFPYEALIKSLVTFLGPILLLVGGFLYGIYQSNRSARLKQLDEEKKIQHNVDKAEQANVELEAKKNEQINEIHSADTVERLLRLWNKGPWGPKS
jgi:hypothetical protein